MRQGAKCVQPTEGAHKAAGNALSRPGSDWARPCVHIHAAERLGTRRYCGYFTNFEQDGKRSPSGRRFAIGADHACSGI